MNFRSGNPVWGDHGCVAIVSCLLVTMCIVSSCSAVLTTSEKDALAQIFENYPDLSSVPLQVSTNEEGEYFGKKWTNNFDKVCLSGGFDIYGVNCSEEGHVSGLLMYVVLGLDESLKLLLGNILTFSDVKPVSPERQNGESHFLPTLILFLD